MSCLPNGHYFPRTKPIGQKDDGADFCACGALQNAKFHPTLGAKGVVKPPRVKLQSVPGVDYGPEIREWKNAFGCACRPQDKGCAVCKPGKYLGIEGDLTKTPHTG